MLNAMDSMTDSQRALLEMYTALKYGGYGKENLIRDLWRTARSNQERDDLKWLEANEHLSNK